MVELLSGNSGLGQLEGSTLANGEVRYTRDTSRSSGRFRGKIYFGF